MSEQRSTKKQSSYWQKLKRHPGVPVLFWMCALGFVAGAMRQDDGGLVSGALGSAFMLIVFGPIVLWTARSQP